MAKVDFTGLMEDTPQQGQYDFSGLMEPDAKVIDKGKKQSLYKALGAEITPEMQQGSPYLSALGKTAQEGIATPALHFGNMALGGLPEVAANQYGYSLPQPETLPSKILTGGAGIAGFMTGLPMKAGGLAANLLPKAAKGASLMAKTGLGAMKGALKVGLASYLHTPEGEFENWRGRAVRGVGGAAVGTVTGGVSGLVDHFTGLISQKALLGTGEETRAGFFGFKGKLTNWFGGKIDRFQKAKPNQRVDLTTAMEDFKTALGDKTKFNALLKASPRLRNVFSKGAAGQKISLKDTQDLINQLKSGVSENQLAGFKVRPSGGEVNEFIKSIQGAKHYAFPEMRFTDKVYGQMSTYTNAVENYMKYGKTVQGIKTMVNNPEMRKSLQTILPADSYNTLMQTAKAQVVTKEGLRAVDYLVRYGILYSFMKNMMNKISPQESAESDSSGG